MKKILFLLIAVSLTLQLVAQESVEAPEPQMQVINKAGETTDLSFGDEYTGEAPVTIKLHANAEEVEGYSLVCAWEFTKDGKTAPYLVRYDADVELELKESGTTIIQPRFTYTSTSNSDIVWEFGPYDYEPFRVVLAESKIEAPNAFSPNGDGINDYYNVFNVKSIVEFSATIFNRWGQKIYSWGIDEIDCETCGWDGTYKGNPVKDGVYFAVIKAKGADGVTYEFRRDVNLLRGYTEETSSSSK
ncbi:MAG: gliding motility-associated C-terminal domain-containing protein [Bacteroidaceae bacterium]|nr:gliding motility-associated C-terminal domain-containing protein [Bacteroidaceae bacterium]